MVTALANLERAKSGQPPLEAEKREPNTLALVAGIGGGAALILCAVLVLSAESRHREQLAAIERAASGPN